MPSNRTAPKATDPADLPTDPEAEVTDADLTAAVKASDPAALMKDAAANLMHYYVGHTDGNPRYLAQGNVNAWAPSLMEAVSLTNAGVRLYTGPTRPEEPGEPGKWVARNVAGDADNATRATWYHLMHRKDAAARVAEGLALLGLDETSPLAWWAPSREQLHKITTSGDPMATAVSLATGATKASAPDGLTSERRRKLDSGVKALLKKLRADRPFDGALLDLKAEKFTPDQIISAVTRLTEGTEDGAKWTNTVRTALTAKATPADS